MYISLFASDIWYLIEVTGGNIKNWGGRIRIWVVKQTKSASHYIHSKNEIRDYSVHYIHAVNHERFWGNHNTDPGDSDVILSNMGEIYVNGVNVIDLWNVRVCSSVYDSNNNGDL